MGNIVALTALDALQCRFCIITLAGEHRVVDKVEIEEIKSGSRSITISLYKKREADIAMRRYLETLSLSCSKPKQVIEDFWTSPSTHVFNEIAFSPLPLPSTTLNYWVGPTIKPQAGSWSRIEEFIVQVICDRDRTVV